jgi:hypothetical protein
MISITQQHYPAGLYDRGTVSWEPTFAVHSQTVTSEARVDPGPARMGFMVDKVILAHFFSNTSVLPS